MMFNCWVKSITKIVWCLLCIENALQIVNIIQFRCWLLIKTLSSFWKIETSNGLIDLCPSKVKITICWTFFLYLFGHTV